MFWNGPYFHSQIQFCNVPVTLSTRYGHSDLSGNSSLVSPHVTRRGSGCDHRCARPKPQHLQTGPDTVRGGGGEGDTGLHSAPSSPRTRDAPGLPEHHCPRLGQWGDAVCSPPTVDMAKAAGAAVSKALLLCGAAQTRSLLLSGENGSNKHCLIPDADQSLSRGSRQRAWHWVCPRELTETVRFML